MVRWEESLEYDAHLLQVLVKAHDVLHTIMLRISTRALI